MNVYLQTAVVKGGDKIAGHVLMTAAIRWM
jgi:hypothetical protein